MMKKRTKKQNVTPPAKAANKPKNTKKSDKKRKALGRQKLKTKGRKKTQKQRQEKKLKQGQEKQKRETPPPIESPTTTA